MYIVYTGLVNNKSVDANGGGGGGGTGGLKFPPPAPCTTGFRPLLLRFLPLCAFLIVKYCVKVAKVLPFLPAPDPLDVPPPCPSPPASHPITPGFPPPRPPPPPPKVYHTCKMTDFNNHKAFFFLFDYNTLIKLKGFMTNNGT